MDDISGKKIYHSVGWNWQSIATAPKDGTPFLAFCPHPRRVNEYRLPVVHWCRRREGWHSYPRPGRMLRESPTHWLPLPEPPTNDATGETA